MKMTKWQLALVYGLVLISLWAIQYSEGKKQGLLHRWCPTYREWLVALETVCTSTSTRRTRREFGAGYMVKASDSDAKSFLSRRFRRNLVGRESGPTDPGEECCQEGCRVEEVREYCGML